MAKIAKHAEFLTSLQKAMSKQAENPTATGVPGKDTHYVSVSEKTEHVDKNSQGKPEKNPQDFHQKPSGDASEPSKAKHGAEAPVATTEAAAPEVAKEASAGAPAAALPDTGKAPVAKAAESKTEQKVAEEAPAPAVAATATPAPETSNVKLAELGGQLLKLIEGMQKEAEKPEASGVPGKDTHYVSVSEKTEHVDKNKQGKPEKNPQDFSQKPATDKSEPAAKAKKASEEVIGEEAEKIASYEFGRSFFRELVKNAVAQPAPQPQQQVKTAGRRDFEQLIAQAAAELEQQQVEKQAAEQAAVEAEAAGAAAFHQFYKQAQYEQALVLAQQNEAALNQKLAALEAEKVAAEKRAAEAEKVAAAKDAALNEKLATEKRAEEMRAWSDYTVKSVIDQLKHEVIPSQR
ncbi:MAG: hypothetical protein EBU46_00960 [Nitrosomonadaceae bacterium]|nr:hypothetical protein [Nitrosomonadaceae bacterium]